MYYYYRGHKGVKMLKGILISADVDRFFCLSEYSTTLQKWTVILKRKFLFFTYQHKYYVEVSNDKNLNEYIGKKVKLKRVTY